MLKIIYAGIQTFGQKYSKNSYMFKYYYNLKLLFCI